MTAPSLLIGDIGGTNARFALAEDSEQAYTSEQILKCADYPSADAAIRHYLDSVGAAEPAAICLAAAGPVTNQTVKFTNNNWTIAVSDLQDVFGIQAVRLLNDFEAIAYSVPLLDSHQFKPIGLPETQPATQGDVTFAIVGPGTGLGAASLRKMANGYIASATEAGHAGFAPETQLQMDILTQLRQRFDRVSAERLVSGPGIENIYWALCEIHGEKRAQLSAADVFSAALSDGDVRATEAVETFYEVLGQFAGDLALTLGATAGVFVAGGVAQRYPDKLANSRFRSSFEAKGRHRTFVERIPTALITHGQPGLLGAAFCVSGGAAVSV
ncbi:MAG: glucokinase [Woeseiaceae bacterium]